MTEPTTKNDEKAIFLAALEKPSADQREAYVVKACGADTYLLARINELLASHEGSLGPLDSPPPQLAEMPTADEPAVEMAGTMIGPFKLREKIGEGGMGLVYVADQKQPVRRRVALKIIKPGMDSQQVLARFAAEQQTLAMMDHPNIAKVLDAGITDNGQPYFVMELVNGISITKYCDQKQLTPKQRIELFIPVCQAVQHAHQKGIIHRDLKPSNILLAMFDGRPVPKVIDFGVAKATNQSLFDQSVYTQLGQLVGTLEYMSPEQAGRNQLDIDTRSDIYSLGVVLYELLTGETPFERKRLRSAAIDEMLRIIREEEPPKPSTKLSSSQSLPSVAESRHTEPAKLSALMRGELDWIVMKALDKDRVRRYESASALAADMQHYLSDEQVVACPPSQFYRFQKFARRNKLTLATGGVVAAALMIGIAGTSWQAIRAYRNEKEAVDQKKVVEHQRDRAIKAEALAQTRFEEAEQARQKESEARVRIEQEKKRADSEAAIANAVRDFLQKDLLGMADAAEQYAAGMQPEPDIRLKTLLDRAPKLVDERFADQPRIRAEIQATLGDAFQAIGEHPVAVQLYQQVADYFRDNLGVENPRTLFFMNDLAVALQYDGQHQQAIPLHEETLRLRQKVLGDLHLDTIKSMNNLAGAYHSVGQIEQAIERYRQTLERQIKVLGEHDANTLITSNNLAGAYLADGRINKAIELNKKTLASRKIHMGARHPQSLESMNNLGLAYYYDRQYEQAINLHEKTLALRQEILGADHPQTLRSMGSLASAFLAVRDFDRAIDLFEQAADLRESRWGAEDPVTLKFKNNLADAYHSAGQFEKAIEQHAETLRLRKKILEPGHPDTFTSIGLLATAYQSVGNYGRAIELYTEKVELCRKFLGADNPETLKSMNNLAAAYQRNQQYEQAIKFHRQTLELVKKILGPEHANTMTSMTNLAKAHESAGQYEQAIELKEKILEIKNETLGAEHPDTLSSMSSLAVSYWSAKQLDKSIPLFEKVVQHQESRLGRTHPDTLVAIANLGVNYKDAGQLEKAVPLLEESWHIRDWVGPRLLDAYVQSENNEKVVSLANELVADARAKLPADSPQLAGQLALLGQALLHVQEFEAAEPLLRECLTIRQQALPDSWLTFNTQSLLGGALLAQKKYDDAQKLLLAGYEGMKQREAMIPEKVKQARLTKALQRVVRLFESWHRAEPDRGYDSKASEWQRKLDEQNGQQAQSNSDGQRDN